mgnify:CR=1 FL=1
MNKQLLNLRVGIGQDSHPLVKKDESNNKELVLGGTTISSQYFLQAMSDGDVIIHSLCNALSSAMGGGSLGTWANKMHSQGIGDSKKYLQKILSKMVESGYQIINLSISVEAKQPKLENHRKLITSTLARQLKINQNQIGLTITSGEDLTAFGKGLAIQAFCVVLLANNL